MERLQVTVSVETRSFEDGFVRSWSLFEFQDELVQHRVGATKVRLSSYQLIEPQSPGTIIDRHDSEDMGDIQSALGDIYRLADIVLRSGDAWNLAAEVKAQTKLRPFEGESPRATRDKLNQLREDLQFIKDCRDTIYLNRSKDWSE